MAVVALPVPIAAASPITEYPLSNNSSDIYSIAAGSDGGLWFNEPQTNKIGRIDSRTHEVTEYPIPTYPGDELRNPFAVARGSDGAIWFTAEAETEEIAQEIARIDPLTGEVSRFTVPGPGLLGCTCAPIAEGPDGALWFTLGGGQGIGRIDPVSDAIAEYPVPFGIQVPYAIAAGPDDTVWFTEQFGSEIIRFDPSTDGFGGFGLGGNGQRATGIAAGPEGALWFTQRGPEPDIARLDPHTGTVTAYPIPSGASAATQIAAGPDGAMWFTQGGRPGHIGRIDPKTGAITEYPTPNPDAGPTAITAGPDGAMWFADFLGGAIGRVAVPHPTTTTLRCGRRMFLASRPSVCTAIVTDVAVGATPSAPTGIVSFSSSVAGRFSPSGGCTTTVRSASTSSCSVEYAATVAKGARRHPQTITASYDGDEMHTSSSDSDTLSGRALGPYPPDAGGARPVRGS